MVARVKDRETTESEDERKFHKQKLKQVLDAEIMTSSSDDLFSKNGVFSFSYRQKAISDLIVFLQILKIFNQLKFADSFLIF